MQIKLEEILSETKLGRDITPKEFNKKFSRELKKVNGELKHLYGEIIHQYNMTASVKTEFDTFAHVLSKGSVVSPTTINGVKDELDGLRKQIIKKFRMDSGKNIKMICDKIAAKVKDLDALANKIYKNEYINKE